jgi:hypothetical protein
MANIYQVAGGQCAAGCTPAIVQVPAPSFCDTRILQTAETIVGFLNCDVSATATPPLPEPPTLAALQTLVAANLLSFKKVQRFNDPGEEAVEQEIDAFLGSAIVGFNKTITFDDSFFDFATETDRLYWDNKTRLANDKKLHFVTIFKEDLITFYRASLTLSGRTVYDATAKNLVRRTFTAKLMWDDREARNWNPYLIPGIYAAFQGT